MNEKLTLEKLESTGIINSNINKVIALLLLSINDWPLLINSLEDYELEVKNFIKSNVTKQKIEETLINIDFLKNAWQTESLTQLLEVFAFYDEGTSLEEIITDLKIVLETEKT